MSSGTKYIENLHEKRILDRTMWLEGSQSPDSLHLIGDSKTPTKAKSIYLRCAGRFGTSCQINKFDSSEDEYDVESSLDQSQIE